MEVTNQKFDFTKHLASDFREEALSDGTYLDRLLKQDHVMTQASKAVCFQYYFSRKEVQPNMK